MLYFATRNRHKFAEAKALLASRGIAIAHFPFTHTELRSDSLETIARDAAKAAYAKIKKPVFVEDSGLFVDALQGFPGTYSAWALEKIGYEGILQLLKGKGRNAHFNACIALATQNGMRIFHGQCNGRIALRANGRGGFGYDPVFIPAGHRRTFAESKALKNKLSHRYKSLLALARYIHPRRYDKE